MRLTKLSILYLFFASSMFIKSVETLSFISLTDGWIYFGSAGQSDIAVRGPMLMGFFILPIIIISLIICLVIVVFILQKRRAYLLYGILITPISWIIVLLLTFARILDYPVGILNLVAGNFSAYIYNILLLILSIWFFADKRFIRIVRKDTTLIT